MLRIIPIWSARTAAGKIEVFGKSHINEIADKFELPVLAKLPIDPSVAEAYDNGLMETVNTDAVSGVIDAVLKA